MLTPDPFKTARIIAVQPIFDPNCFSGDKESTSDPAILSYLTNIVRLWGMSRSDLPTDFVDEIRLDAVERKPLWLLKHRVEILAMRILREDRPFQGQSVDSTQWPSTNPFDFIVFKKGRFPEKEAVEREEVPGNQSIEECPTCKGAGQSECTSCVGGQMPCPDCQGSVQVACLGCAGTGRSIGTRGQLIICRACGGRMYNRCRRCSRGTITCNICMGRGVSDCDRCESFGRLHVFYVVEKRTRSVEQILKHEDIYSSFDLSSLASELDSVVDFGFLPGDLDTVNQIAEVPKTLSQATASQIQCVCRNELKRCTESIGVDERPIALKHTLYGGYFYSLEVNYRKTKHIIFLCGINNRVFFQTRKSKGSIVGSLKKLHYNLLNSMIGYKLPIDRDFLKAAKEGSVHIGDTQRLIAQVPNFLDGGKMSVTEDGYLFEFEDPSFANVSVKVDYNRVNQQIVCISSLVDKSERQKYAQSLLLSGKLQFGRIALSQDEQFFMLEERRFYKYLNPENLAVIVRSLARDSGIIREKGWLA
jgi:hypothetical protein